MVDLTLPVGRTPGCDFCSVGIPAVKEYPCETFEMAQFHAEDMPTQITNSIGNWFACEECAKLIDMDDRDELARRAAEVILQARIETGEGARYTTKLQRDAIVMSVAVAHSGFFAHRITKI